MQKILKRLASILNEGIALHKVGSQIEIINNRVTNLRSSLETYGIKSFMEGESSNAAAEAKRLVRQTYPHEEDEHFIGMEDDIKELISLLVEEKKESTHGIISLIGMGGSGKTTLAKKIYNHDNIKSCFNAFAWVCITQQCQARSVMREMLKQLVPQITAETIKNMEDREVVQQLYEVQHDKKCLVVIDDIWNVDVWKSLSHCFPKVECNSRVLLTTRKRDVAEIGFPYELKALTETEGWQLLRQVAFPQASINENIPVDPNQFESIGKAMVQKCGYLPLAIVVLGGILKGKRHLKDWESIKNDIDLYLRKGNGKGVQVEDVVQQVLALSYEDLPYYLKQCFLYFGSFKEDELIDTKRLYYLWMAEGMISSNDRESKEMMRDVSERYLEELARRCVVQVEKNGVLNEIGRFSSCWLHDLMHDYCLLKCKEENFLDVMDKGRPIDPHHTFTNSCRMTMRVNLDTVGTSIRIPSEQISNGLRSLQIVCDFSLHGKCDQIPPAISSVGRFKLLRTLVINQYNFKGKSLDGMEKLIHLRYLGLTECELDRLPSSIVKLSYLKILDLTDTHLTEYPTIIHRLGGIRYLYLPKLIDNQPKRKFSFKDLHQLEILIGVESEYHDFADLSALKNLRILKAMISQETASLLQLTYCLNTSENINLTYAQVIVYHCVLNSVHMTEMLTCHNLHQLHIWRGQILGWPYYVEFPRLSSSIVTLYFWSCEFEEDPIPILERLPNLKSLQFTGKLFSRKEMSCDAGGFPQLVELIFWIVDEGNLRIDEGAMPNLKYLRVCSCSDQLKLTIPNKLKSLLRHDLVS